ncbi:MAG: Asp-tRNA(Asn)/Glu-tRNA(Gln) amidotransferase subunit GatB [Planctomycetota bacterium]|jgi:aspartyl-tRNA(Asn)/glutamyl-tRNA(Gln) amidotransferase subunit B
MDYEPVIGLETHAELLTASKLWCACSTRFGQAPNSQTCPVCLGMPGVLPVLNIEAFELALRAALALHCTINRDTFFDRKNYYYPDLPKNYQISQNYCNLGVDGYLEVPLDGGSRRVGILNVHLEEDAGKNLHVQRPGADYSLVDLNRAGTPLLEIVSAPDVHGVEEADAFMQILRQVLLYTRVSDCKMQEGSLRFEASISRRPAGSEGLGTRVEIKNLNSMKAVRLALAYEILRQGSLLKDGQPVEQETRLWDEARERSGHMRAKEQAQDYRYFPEPDLLPIRIDQETMERVAGGLPEPPLQRRERFERELGLSEYEAGVLTNQREVADYFEACLVAGVAPKSAANWIMNEVLGQLNERSIPISEFEVPPERLAELVRLLDDGKITAQAARQVMGRLLQLDTSGTTAVQVVQKLDLGQISDESALAAVIDQVIEENSQAVQDYLGGRTQALGALVGQVMRATRGKADPKLANRMLRERLDALSGG